MKKYLAIFNISFQEEFAYRWSFIMWRVRNVIQVFLIFSLWNAVFYNSTRQVFGYSRDMILTYVFGILIIRAIVFSARTVDISDQISTGEMSNLLLKPVNFFKYWLVRDLSSKVLNLIFAVGETAILFLLLKPPFFLQTNPINLLGFVFSVILALFIFFCLLFLANMVAFWAPEMGWSIQFLFIMIIGEFLSGSAFPLDILPLGVQKVLSYLPFSYLVFFPLQVYLGKISGLLMGRGLLIALVWAVLLVIILRFVWNKGIKRYAAEGR